MKRIFPPLVAALLFASPMVLAETPPAAELGISKTKPESGPYVEIEGGFMVPYTHSIERTGISFEMIPVPGGEIKIGSPDSEEGREEDEGPQYTVVVDPFWVAKTEVTWAEYKTFMRNYDVFKRLYSARTRMVDETNEADAVTVPTPLYDPSLTFMYGEDNQQPAVTMTQFAAQQYTKWLSGITKVQYRIPSEGEWEYAARAGAETAFSFGDSRDEIEEYGVFEDNAEDGPAKVGTKKPNKFGLHDMHGNVWEWTIEQHDTYERLGGKKVHWLDAIRWQKGPDHYVARGGGWSDPAERLRSAARLASDDVVWKDSDPNIPRSPWWYTDDPVWMVGMRIVRSAKPLPPEVITKFWNADEENLLEDVKARLEEGRGAKGLAVPELIPDFQRRR